MKSDQIVVHFVLILKNLSNCVNVNIIDLLYDLNRNFKKFNANQLLIIKMILSTNIDFVKQFISITMAAVNAFDCILKIFYIDHMIESIKIQQFSKFSSNQFDFSFSSYFFCF